MRLLKEPVLQFVALGGLIFGIHSGLGALQPETDPQPSILMTVTDAEWLRETWTRQWHRPPTDEELTGLVADHLREEVLAHEARMMELDVGDVIVRRRLAQKMSFLMDGTIRIAQPPDADLHALYDSRPDLMMSPARVSFTQLFFRGGGGDDRARATLAALSSDGSEAADQGNGLLLGDTFTEKDETELAGLFGPSFARAVLALPVGRSLEPIKSGYGMHLVNVTAVYPPRALPFAEVHGRLAAEWLRLRQDEAQEKLLQDLMLKHRVVVDASVVPWLGPLTGRVEVRP